MEESQENGKKTIPNMDLNDVYYCGKKKIWSFNLHEAFFLSSSI